MIELRRPTLEDERAVMAMIEEFEETQAAHDGGFWQSDGFDYRAWLATNIASEMGLCLSDGWVPAIQLVGFVGDRAVGFLNLRLRLNDRLRKKGGHIGYCVRPSDQGKGYAKAMLAQGLAIADSKNIKRILVTCSLDNAASRAVILSGGGRLEDICQGIARYWIER